MLIVSRAKISIRGVGRADVEGGLAPHTGKIVGFLQDLGLKSGTIRHRFGRYVFSREIDRSARQRLRNFLVNECPMKDR